MKTNEESMLVEAFRSAGRLPVIFPMELSACSSEMAAVLEAKVSSAQTQGSISKDTAGCVRFLTPPILTAPDVLNCGKKKLNPSKQVFEKHRTLSSELAFAQGMTETEQLFASQTNPTMSCQSKG